MKIITFLLFIVSSVSCYAQQTVKKPEYVIIADSQIITKAQVDEYSRQGYVKRIKKGVSEDERNELAKKFGDRIGDKEFIVMISLDSNNKLPQTGAPPKDTVQAKNKEMMTVNEPAKDFTVEMINGEKNKLSRLKGKVVLINFWATWCAPCLMEFYDFPSKLITPFKDSAFVLLPISRGESAETVKNKMEKLKGDGISFNVGLDPTESIYKLYDYGAIPESILIDKKGRMRFIFIGNPEGNADHVATMIKKLLAE